MNFFGRSKKAAAPAVSGVAKGGSSNVDPGSALQQVKERVSALEKRIEFLEKKGQQCLLDAKRFSVAKNKAGAMQSLKRKKMYEKEVDKLRIAMTNLEQQAFNIENASTTMDIVNGMKIGKDAASNLAKQLDVEDVQELQDDIADGMQQQQEINDILSRPMGTDVADDDELLAELDELDMEEENELDELEAKPSAATSSLPAAPKGKVHVPSVAVEEDEDAAALAALEAEMAA